MTKSKTNLDERQELKLLKIEHNGCLLAFWGLLASMILQIIFGNNKPENLIGEWSVFMLLALYMVCACMKNGIWDRKLKPDLRTNAVVSLIPAVLMGILFTALFYFYNKNFYYSFLIGVIMFLSIAVLCFSVLTILSGIYKKRVAKMESEIDEE